MTSPTQAPTTQQGPSDPGIGRRAAVGARQQGSSQLFRLVLQLTASVALARLVLPHTFGLVAVSLAVTQLVAAAVLAPVSRAVVSLRLSRRAQLDTAWTMSVLATAVPLAGGVAVSLALPLSADAATALVGILATLPLQATAELQVARLQDDHDFATIARSRALATLTSVVVALALALLGQGLLALIARVWITPACVVATAGWRTRWLPRPRLRRPTVARIVGFARPLSVANILSVSRRRGDDVLVGAVLGPSALGLYNVAYRFLEVPVQQVNELTSTVLLPTFAAMADRRSVVDAFVRSQRLLLWLVTPVGIVSLLAGDVLVPAVLGEQWRAAGPVVQVFGVVTVLQAAGTNVGTLFQSADATGAAMRVALWTTPLVLAGFLAGMPWGIVGVSVGYLVATIVVGYPSYRYAARAVGASTRALVAGVGRLLGVAAGTTVAGWLVRSRWADGWIEVTAVSLGAAVAFWVLAASSPPLLADLRRVAARR